MKNDHKSFFSSTLFGVENNYFLMDFKEKTKDLACIFLYHLEKFNRARSNHSFSNRSEEAAFSFLLVNLFISVDSVKDNLNTLEDSQ